MFARWLEEYQRLSQKTRFLSQLATFLISIFSFLSLYKLAKFYNEDTRLFNSFVEEDSEFLLAIAFQIAILIIFVVRFALLFFKSSKTFLASQILWIFGLSVLASYWLASRPPEGSFEIYATYPTIFIYASRSFDSFGILYLVFSPIRQFITLIISIIKAGRNKV